MTTYRAWRHLAKKFLVAAVCGYLFALLLVSIFGVRPLSVFDAATIGVRHVSMPLAERANNWLLGPSMVVFFFNSFAALALASFLFTARLFNPSNINRFPSWFRRMLIKDPSIKILAWLPGYKSIADPKLRPVYACLLVVPSVGVIALGLMIGALLFAGVAVTGRGTGGFAVILGYVVPHGVFEISALLGGAALPVAAYLAARADLESDRADEAFATIERLASLTAIRRNLVIILALLLLAALIEMNLTADVGDALAHLFQ